MMQYKTTRRLFKGAYQYKIVLVCAAAGWFRSGDMDTTLSFLKKLKEEKDRYNTYRSNTLSEDELSYAFQLQKQLKKLKDIEVRVESPWISVYSNSKSDVDSLTKLDSTRVKYISAPDASLEKDTVVMPKMDFDFRITMGKTTKEHTGFIEWAENNPKVKLTKSCVRDLSKDRSWGGTHFYITGEKNLLLARMHLGGSINKIERIIKQTKA